jgi:peptidoglycan/LPS O-acetylase OafA/YrhL
MTAGAILLPDIVLVLALVAGIVLACATAILSEFTIENGTANANDNWRSRKRPSPVQQWMVHRAADMTAMME